ncbi:MAG: exonuclease SbcCD subunit D [Solobacterium sp.]|nr:exonuclease SbcCD subunit D [Solobacterium sp.]
MKLIHLSDLHIGKRVNEYSMLEDQEYILKKILNILDEEHPDAVMIAGDVYDKAVPSAEAVELFDEFLVSLARRRFQVLIISGNHDSPERLAFGNRLIDASGIHISPVYNGEVKPLVLEDEYGPVNFYCLPFIKPVHVRRFFPEEEITSYTDALRIAVNHMNINPLERNVLITHQFVTGAARSDSEEISVGGSDNVDASVFEAFDYVALGHIHGPQNIGSERIRYCGTPLKYSFSEANHHKSVTVVGLKEKGIVEVSTIPLLPKRDLVELRGTYEEVTAKQFYENTNWQEDYTHITLTDEEDIPDAMSQLRVIYHNLMKLDYDNRRTRSEAHLEGTADVENKSPIELFGELYEMQNGTELSAVQSEYLQKMIEEIWGQES